MSENNPAKSQAHFATVAEWADYKKGVDMLGVFSSVEGWQPIETAPKPGTKRMFVVQAFKVRVHGVHYTSDPVCTWRDEDGNFVRWLHDFPPTHWTSLPDPP